MALYPQRTTKWSEEPQYMLHGFYDFWNKLYPETSTPSWKLPLEIVCMLPLLANKQKIMSAICINQLPEGGSISIRKHRRYNSLHSLKKPLRSYLQRLYAWLSTWATVKIEIPSWDLYNTKLVHHCFFLPSNSMRHSFSWIMSLTPSTKDSNGTKWKHKQRVSNPEVPT